MFKKGDKVRSLVSLGNFRTKGEIYTIRDVDSIIGNTQYYYKDNHGDNRVTSDPTSFELVKEPSKREIDVIVDSRTLSGSSTSPITVYNNHAAYPMDCTMLNAKLIVELPEEKEVTITESQFDEMIRSVEDQFTDYAPTKNVLKRAKKELGL